jgi:hypothetical protein
MNEIFLKLTIESNKSVQKSDIIEILKSKSHISGATLGRRAQTIVSWFKWIRNNIGLVEVDENGNITIQKHLNSQ